MENMNGGKSGVGADMRAPIAFVDPELDPNMSQEAMREKL